MMSLYLKQLERALASLDRALAAYNGSPLDPGSPEKMLMRDGVIQSFEYSFELSWEILRRYLQEYGLEQVDAFTNKELFRAGAEAGLLAAAEAWLDYLRRRNLTSRTYNEATAE